jgi:hypothetical protein
MLKFTEHEKALIINAINNKIEDLEAEIRVINKDSDLLDTDDMFFTDNFLELVVRKESAENNIYCYKEIIKRLEA